MHVRTRELIVCLLALGLTLPILGAASVRAELQLAEILADPASDWNNDGELHLRDDEWIEVRNAGPDIVVLSGYYLRDGLGEDPHLELGGVLEPGEVAVFYGSDAATWQEANDMGVSGLSLNNAGDTVELIRADPDGGGWLVVDSYEFLDHEAEDERSSGRLLQSGVWALFDGLNPYDGTTEPLGTACVPDPGTPNGCQPLVPASAATWGSLKSRYH